jgi:hypothetical protein
MNYTHALKFSILFLLLNLACLSLFSQNDSINYGFITEEGDSLIHVDLDEFVITAPFIIKTRKQKRVYGRLAKDLKKAYPLAKIVNKELMIVQDTLTSFELESESRKFMKQYEKIVYNKYIDSLKQLNLRQGKLFLKLISRETGESGYTLIKEYRGNFSAAFWQTMARIFGSTLKTSYNTEEEAMIEDILQRIDAGLI